MTTIQTQVHIDAPAASVWAVLADFGGIEKFNPGVQKSRSLTDANSGIGAERQCDFGPSTSIRERIVEWDEGKNFTLEIYEGKNSPPFKTAFTTFSVSPGSSGSYVTAELRYSLKGGPIGWLLNRLVVNRKFGGAMSDLLAGLKQHVETGETIDAGTSLDLSAVLTAP